MKTLQEQFESRFAGSFSFEKYTIDGRYMSTNTMCAWLGYQGAVLEAHESKLRLIDSITAVMQKEIQDEKDCINNAISV